VSVIKTEKKGYGLRADTDLEPGDLIFEYIGEVINEPAFRRRTIQYHEDGIKHFYFMSLNKSEFIDATRKGNLGRFCNHSCNPNCEVQKWIVGDKVRMGIFAERSIQAGEELVFNYNVDRYGADPQPCYCGEPNCTGFLGGKTQTERATKLSHTFTEALGIEDGDGWDTVVAKKPRKRKTGEDDEEYVNNVQVKGLDENGVSKVMAALMQCTEKWIAVKLLNRIQQRSEDKTILTKVVAFHGYQILKKALDTWKEDNNIVLQILEILYKLPRFTRNKIVDSKIEASLEPLTTSEHEDIASESQRLLKEWAKLEVAYRIPRKKFDPSAQANSAYGPRREETRVETPQSAPSMPTIVAPTGPKSSIPQRGPVRQPLAVRAPPVRRPLPSGWFVATSTDGKTYYYNRVGDVTWQRPTIPSVAVPKVEKQKTVSREAHLQSIIDAITREKEEASSKTATPKPVEEEVKVKRKPEKWRSLPIEKQMKLYENTVGSPTPIPRPIVTDCP
jgi:histone-lysine N-methyltransferase SETD2